MITVLGASGFVGSNLVNMLHEKGMDFYAPKREETLVQKSLGHIIYCIGMTADFRSKPFETVEAHVCKLAAVLQTCNFESLTYLSSTRVYIKSKSSEKKLLESDDIVINATDATDIFAASKITGELLALNSGKKNIKVVRLSNVFGADFLSQNFITSIVNDAIANQKVELFTTPDSAKDYISVEDVCTALIKLAECAEPGIYNLAYGSNTSNEEILNELNKLTGAAISYAPAAQKILFQEISNEKLTKTIGFTPAKGIIDCLPDIITAFKKQNV
jgi:nucleoside-diphosphate-sugar epimerase